MRHAADSKSVTISCACGWHRVVKADDVKAGAGPSPNAITERMSRTAFAEHEHHRNTSVAKS